MSSASPTPPRDTDKPDESQLPQGHCRYILLVPELKGHRCGCTHFSLNRAVPGAACECGHLACYHVNNSHLPSLPGTQDVGILEQRLRQLEKEHVELHQLRREVTLLQEQLAQDGCRNQDLVERVIEMEDVAERSKADIKERVREAYENIVQTWNSISDLKNRSESTDKQLRRIQEKLAAVDGKLPRITESHLELEAEVSRVSHRQHELADINIALEERIDELEELTELEDRVHALEKKQNASARGSHRPSSSAASSASLLFSNAGHHSLPPPSPLPRPADFSMSGRAQSLPGPSPFSSSASPLSGTLGQGAAGSLASGIHPLLNLDERRRSLEDYHSSVLPPPPVLAQSDELWTVHISLMPASTLPFPFERDTNAYKRCLSRGLHQMVPVSGTSAEAVETAVRRAFRGFLRDHAWMPLKAEPCTADGLTGLPMLRQLDSSLVDGPYDLNFLLQNCAVRNIYGKIDSLYIAMRHRTISWYKLRKAPVFLEGLEACWDHDKVLDSGADEIAASGSDGGDSSEDEFSGRSSRPPAGDIVAKLPSLKRAASEMLHPSGFAAGPSSAYATNAASASPTAMAVSTHEGEGSRTKVPRIHPLPDLVEIRRGVKIT